MKKRKNILFALAAVLAVSITTAIPANGATISVETTAATVETSSTQETSITNEIPAVGDCVCTMLGSESVFWSSDGRNKLVISGGPTEFYLIGKYFPSEEELEAPDFEGVDWNYSFRAYVPLFPKPERVMHIEIDPSVTIIRNHDGPIIGNLNSDRRVDVFDLVKLRQLVIMHNTDKIENDLDRILSDINGDTEVSIADLVDLSRQILGAG